MLVQLLEMYDTTKIAVIKRMSFVNTSNTFVQMTKMQLLL